MLSLGDVISLLVRLKSMLKELKGGDSSARSVREWHCKNHSIPLKIASFFVVLVVFPVLCRYRKIVHPTTLLILCNM